MPATTVLTGSWRPALEALVGSANQRLTLCAPYISERGVEAVNRGRCGKASVGLDVLLLTDLSALPVSAGATDPTAILALGNSLPRIRTVHLPRMHAKVYAADGARAVVTSGNLTHGGLHANYECGLLVEDPTLARKIEDEVVEYAALGAEMDRVTLDKVCELAVEARAAYRVQMASASKASTRRLARALDSASETLVRARLAEGPIHTVFARTIEFLLHRHTRLSTEQMHPLIRQMHADLCDDSVDRVIDGKRYGKKWKHAVRTAQQQLKKRGSIALIDGFWTLVR